MLKASSDVPIIDKEDFRDELDVAHYPNGIVFDIYVSDVTHKSNEDGWKRIGLIHLDDSMVSYGCDRRLHFAHPKLKDGDAGAYHDVSFKTPVGDDG